MRVGIVGGLLLALVLSYSRPIPAADATGIVSGVVHHASVQGYPTVVYIEEIPGQKFTPPSAKVNMDQKDKIFTPHVLPVLVGSTVEFLNNDNMEHNVFGVGAEEFDLGNWTKGIARKHTFAKPGEVTILCNVHPNMLAYVVVLKTPYFAVTDGAGSFRIPNVPAGTWKLKVWNERFKPPQLAKTYDVKVAAGQDSKTEITF